MHKPHIFGRFMVKEKSLAFSNTWILKSCQTLKSNFNCID